jgi:hypothetical protein
MLCQQASFTKTIGCFVSLERHDVPRDIYWHAGDSDYKLRSTQKSTEISSSQSRHVMGSSLLPNTV